MIPELEDLYEDIIGKAQRGLGLQDADVVRQAGVSLEAWKAALRGTFSEQTARAVAPVLGLDADALVGIGSGTWKPEPVQLDGLAQISSTFGDMRVNAYLVWDPHSRAAVLFDSGTDAEAIITVVREQSLQVETILLTHTHADHIEALPAVREAFPEASLWAHEKGALPNARDFDQGHRFGAGSLRIEARHTPGHSTDGVTFVVDGLEQPVAVVGDAIFAGSMGGAPNAWKNALAVNREKILSLPENTVLCPGHGPMTTIAEELRHNPCYAGDDPSAKY